MFATRRKWYLNVECQSIITAYYMQVLHLYAVKRALEQLSPPMKKDNPAASLIPWLNEVRLAQNAITSILNFPSRNELKTDSQYETFIACQIEQKCVLHAWHCVFNFLQVKLGCNSIISTFLGTHHIEA